MTGKLQTLIRRLFVTPAVHSGIPGNTINKIPKLNFYFEAKRKPLLLRTLYRYTKLKKNAAKQFLYFLVVNNA